MHEYQDQVIGLDCRQSQADAFWRCVQSSRLLGFMHSGGAGSHRAFQRTGEPIGLNFQNCGGFIAPYQARQLIAMIEKYGERP